MYEILYVLPQCNFVMQYRWLTMCLTFAGNILYDDFNYIFTTRWRVLEMNIFGSACIVFLTIFSLAGKILFFITVIQLGRYSTHDFVFNTCWKIIIFLITLSTLAGKVLYSWLCFQHMLEKYCIFRIVLYSWLYFQHLLERYCNLDYILMLERYCIFSIVFLTMFLTLAGKIL